MPQVNQDYNKIFYNIVNGKIVNKVKEDTPNAVKRENKKGDIVYELVWDSLDGIIAKLEFKDHQEYGKSLVITIDEDGVLSQLQLSCNSKYFHSFVARIKACDLSANIKIVPFSFDDKEKKKRDGTPKVNTGITLYQDDNKIEPNITKENPLKDAPEFPKNTSDKIAMTTYNVNMEKCQVAYINEIVIDYTLPTTEETNKDNSSIEFQDFDENTLGDDEVPF